MSYKVRQKDIREMIAWGVAHPLNEAAKMVENNERSYSDFQKVSYSAGVYGINGLCIEDRTTGELYAEAARTTLVFMFA